MAFIKCPQCDELAPRRTTCGICGYQSRDEDKPSAKAGPSSGCRFCHAGGGVRERYLCVTRRVSRFFNSGWESVFVACPACRRCAVKASWLGTWLTAATGFALFAVPLAVAFGGMWVVGEPARPAGRAAAMTPVLYAAVGAAVGLLVLSVWIGVSRGSWIRHFLGDDLEGAVRAFVGVRWWGVYGAFRMVSQPPTGIAPIPAPAFITLVRS